MLRSPTGSPPAGAARLLLSLGFVLISSGIVTSAAPGVTAPEVPAAATVTLPHRYCCSSFLLLLFLLVQQWAGGGLQARRDGGKLQARCDGDGLQGGRGGGGLQARRGGGGLHARRGGVGYKPDVVGWARGVVGVGYKPGVVGWVGYKPAKRDVDGTVTDSNVCGASLA